MAGLQHTSAGARPQLAAGSFIRRDPYIHPDNPDLVVVPVFDRYDREGKTAATIDLDTFNRLLQAKGLSPYWHMRGGKDFYSNLSKTHAARRRVVFGQIKSRRFQIARLILGLDVIDPKGTSHTVEYLDGNRLNLRKGNLRAKARYGECAA